MGLGGLASATSGCSTGAGAALCDRQGDWRGGKRSVGPECGMAVVKKGVGGLV